MTCSRVRRVILKTNQRFTSQHVSPSKEYLGGCLIRKLVEKVDLNLKVKKVYNKKNRNQTGQNVKVEKHNN